MIETEESFSCCKKTCEGDYLIASFEGDISKGKRKIPTDYGTGMTYNLLVGGNIGVQQLEFSILYAIQNIHTDFLDKFIVSRKWKVSGCEESTGLNWVCSLDSRIVRCMWEDLSEYISFLEEAYVLLLQQCSISTLLYCQTKRHVCHFHQFQ